MQREAEEDGAKAMNRVTVLPKPISKSAHLRTASPANVRRLSRQAKATP